MRSLPFVSAGLSYVPNNFGRGVTVVFSSADQGVGPDDDNDANNVRGPFYFLALLQIANFYFFSFVWRTMAVAVQLLSPTSLPHAGR